MQKSFLVMHKFIPKSFIFSGQRRIRTFDVSNVADLQSAALAARLPAHMVTPAGVEPATSGLKGRRLNQFDYGAMETPTRFELVPLP